MKSRSILPIALLFLLLGCGKDGASSEVSRKGDDLAQRVTKLEDDLHQAKRQLIAQEQALQAMNERLKAAEVNVDKLAYLTARR